MKFQVIYTLLFLSVTVIVLQSLSGGAAANGLGDRTGSPIGGAAGCSCHGGGAFSPTISVVVKDAALNTVTEYIPGASYSLEFSVAASAGTPAGYGFQALAISASNNSNAGSMTSVSSANTQITNFGGRQYAEHLGINPSGIFTVNWTAPAAGFGSVNLYSRGLAVNGSSSSGDQQTSSNLLTLSEQTSISYAASSYCSGASNPLPTLIGIQNGLFSAQPTGLSIVPSTGLVDVSNSQTGQIYTIIYTYNGSDTTTTQITINATDDPSFSYSASNYCQAENDPFPSITGLFGGTFSSDAGLSINTANGLIDLSQSLPGIHNVLYTTNGICPDSTTVSVNIVAFEDASFSYGSSSYCQNAVNPIPSAISTNGTWTASSGLAIDSLNGQIDLSNSSAQVHNITYTTNGSCRDTVTQSIAIIAAQDASFSLPDTFYCQGEPDVLPTILGDTGGLFSSITGLDLDTLSGLIDLTNSTAALHSITYTTNGPCPAVQTLQVQLNNPDDATFTYPSAVYCIDAVNPIPTFLGNGVFSSNPGLSIDTSSGSINLSASIAGSYSIQFASSGVCPDSSINSIDIQDLQVDSFSFVDTLICINQGQNPVLAIVGASNGTYSASPSGLVWLNTSTGAIDLSLSQTGNYLILFTPNDTCALPAQANLDLSMCGAQHLLESSATLQLYPIPSTGTVFLQSNQSIATSTISVFDILGNIVYFGQHKIDADIPFRIPLGLLAAGNYYLKVEDVSTSRTFKLIIQP